MFDVSASAGRWLHLVPVRPCEYYSCFATALTVLPLSGSCGSRYLNGLRGDTPISQWYWHNEAQYSVSLFFEECWQMGVHEDNLFRPGDLAKSASAEELARVAWTILVLHRTFVGIGLKIPSPPWKSSPPSSTSHVFITPSSTDKDSTTSHPIITNDGLSPWPTSFSSLHAGKFLTDSSRALGGRISPALSTITIPQDLVKRSSSNASDSLMNVLKQVRFPQLSEDPSKP